MTNLDENDLVSKRPHAQPRKPALLPSAEVLAVVPIDRVPETVPASLGDTVIAVYEDDRTVDWKLSAESALRPGVVAEFWSWRRAWTASWSIGPTTNVSAVIDVARRIGYTIGRDLLSVLDRISTSEYEDALVDPSAFPDLLEQLDDLRDALTSSAASALGIAMIDATYAGRRPPRTLRRWASHANEIVLTANEHVSVVLHPANGLVLRHGEGYSRELVDIAHVDLRGDQVMVENTEGRKIRLAPAHARPLAWLAPNSIRWDVTRIPLAEVWTPLFDGLPTAVAAARLTASTIRFTSDIVVA